MTEAESPIARANCLCVCVQCGVQRLSHRGGNWGEEGAKGANIRWDLARKAEDPFWQAAAPTGWISLAILSIYRDKDSNMTAARGKATITRLRKRGTSSLRIRFM